MLANLAGRRLHQTILPSHWLYPSSIAAAQLSTSSSTQEQEQADSCWTSHTKTRFSIRPSLLSPLYSAYRKDLDKHDRRQLISRLLEAHMLLARELEGFDVNQVTSIARDHAKSLQSLANDLETLAPRNSVGACTHRNTMLGYYSLLEEQLGSGPPSISSSQRALKSDSSSSSSEVREIAPEAGIGPSSVWQAWMEHFVSKYQQSPSLEPLEVIYAKKNMLSALKQLRKPSKDAQSGKLQLLGQEGVQKERVRHGAHITLEGVAVAEGKRKTSRALVRMQRAPGRNGVSVKINGMPYNEYFKGPELRQALLAPMLLSTNTLMKFAVDVQVHGGGISSQAQAARTGIARALRLFVHTPYKSTKSENHSLTWLRKLVRWDKRSVERKKPGRKKARKSFAWVKR